MNLTLALAMDAKKIAAIIGVTKRTARRWIAGVQKPNKRNRELLADLVARVHREHSAAAHRWSARRDEALCSIKLALMAPAERDLFEANRNRMRAQFAPAAA